MSLRVFSRCGPRVAWAFPALLAACSWFDAPDTDETPRYRRESLWVQPAIAAIGTVGADDSAVYVVDLQRTLRRVNRKDGAMQWAVPTGTLGSTVKVDRVGPVVLVSAGQLVAFDPHTGAELWRDLSPDSLGVLQFSTVGSMILPSTFRSAEGAVYALTASHETVWRASVAPGDSVIAPSGQFRAYTAAAADGLVAHSYTWWRTLNGITPLGGIAVIDQQSGQLRWSKLLPPPQSALANFPSDPVIGAGMVFVASRDGRVHGYSAQDGQPLWVASGETNPDTRPLAFVGSTVVAGSGQDLLTGYQASSGERRWGTRTENGGAIAMRPLLQVGALVNHWNGGLSLVDAGTGRLLWAQYPVVDRDRVTGVRVAGDTVFTSGPTSGLQAFRLVER